MKGNIIFNIDTEVTVPARTIAQDLAKTDSFTQADFLIWFFNELFFRVCNSDSRLFKMQLAYIEGDLDHKTKRLLKDWVCSFADYRSEENGRTGK